MSKCEITTGIFVLEHCGKPAKMQCPDCGKAACSRHSTEQNGQKLCLPCAARRKKAETIGKDKQWWLHNPEDADLYYFLLQEDFRVNSDFKPFSLADFIAFDQEGLPEMEESSEAPTFFDS